MNPIRFMHVNCYTGVACKQGAPAVCFQLEQSVHQSVTDEQKLTYVREFLGASHEKANEDAAVTSVVPANRSPLLTEVAVITLRAGKNQLLQVFNKDGEVSMPLHERNILAAAHVLQRGIGGPQTVKPKPVMIFDTNAGPATIVVKKISVDLGSRMLSRYEIKFPSKPGKKLLNLAAEAPPFLAECLYSIGKFISPEMKDKKPVEKKANRFAARSAERAENTLALKGLMRGKDTSKIKPEEDAAATDAGGPTVPPFYPKEGRRTGDYLMLVFESEEAIREVKFDRARYALELEHYKEGAEHYTGEPLPSMLVCTAKSKAPKTAAGDDLSFVTRVFSAQNGEEEATASVFSTLMPYWNEKLSDPKLFCQQLCPRGGHIVAEIMPNQGKVAGDPNDEFVDPKDQVLVSGMAACFCEGAIPEEVWNAQFDPKKK
ncbi:unnamed protein product [Amoebophrya sp. A25]|nr:unnamed protein product [Amoebophrya sp. A25]|eukprot:GSA25T00004615001.1